MYSNDLMDWYVGLFTGGNLVMMSIVGILSIIGMWKIFEKAGREGWKAIIPFYNLYVLFDIAWGNGWLFLLLLIPCVGLVISIIVDFKLAKAFGKGVGYAIGLIFLYPIFLLMLGFGNAAYIGPDGTASPL